MTIFPGLTSNSICSPTDRSAAHHGRTFPPGTAQMSSAPLSHRCFRHFWRNSWRNFPGAGRTGFLHSHHITSRLRSSTHPDVLVLYRNRPLLPTQAPPPSPVDTRVPLDNAFPLPSDANLDLEKVFPPTSLLHLPGRPLTLADFPPSQIPPNADLPSPTP